MTNTTIITPDHPDYQIHRFAYVLSLAIKNHGVRMKVFVQDGMVRLAAPSVAEARIMIERAERYGDVKIADIADVFQVRFWGTNLVGTYATRYDSMRQGVQPGTGLIIDQSSPELVYPTRHICQHCGQQPLHHTSRCPNRRN